jgi:hypothetical protein
MEYKGAGHVNPNYKMDAQFIYTDLASALHSDSSIFTHPISATVQDPNDIEEIFDDISYAKGSSVLRMLEGYMGYKVFFERIHEYLMRHEYENTKTDDLWDALDGDSGTDVSEMMTSWTDQEGYPLVVVDHSKSRISVRQERFFKTKLMNKEQESIIFKDRKHLKDVYTNNTQTWRVHVLFEVYSSQDSYTAPITVEKVYLKDQDNLKIPITRPTTDIWISNPGPGHTGVFHTRYDEAHWNSILNAFRNHPKNAPFTSFARASLYLYIRHLHSNSRDAFAACWSSGPPSPSKLLEFVKYLEFETDHAVWTIALSGLRSPRSALSLHPIYGRFGAFQRRIMQSIVKDIGWNETSENKNEWHVRSMLRTQVLTEMILLDDIDTVVTAKKYFQDLKNGVDVELVPEVLDIV